MAIESERLLAIFEAKFSSLDKALSKARTNAQKSFGDIEAAGSRAEAVLAKVGSRGLPGIDKATKSMKSLQGQTGNLAAQFNDIGVQLASGTSPFLVAIQQGSQINQVLGQAGAAGAAKALGGAFMSLLNPVSLATFAVIALGGEAIQYFSSMVSGGEQTKKSLQEQANAIQQVAQKWGDALPAVKAYADELKRQQEAAQLQLATNTTVTHLLDEAKTSLGAVNSQLITLTGSAKDLSAFQDGFYGAQIAMAKFEKRLQDGKATTEDYEAVNKDLTALLGNDAVQANAQLATSIENLRDRYLAAAQAAGILVGQQKALSGIPTEGLANNLGQLSPVYSDNGKLENPAEYENTKANATKSQFQTDAEKSTKSGGSRENSYERQVAQIQKRTSALQAETNAQRSLNPLINDYGEAMATARARSDLLAAAERAHVKLTPDMVAAIDQIAAAYGQATAQSNQLSKAQEDVRRSAIENLDAVRGIMRGVIDDFRQGKSAAEILADALSKVADRLEDMALDSLFGKQGSTSGGIFGSLLSGLGSLLGGGSSDPWAGLRLPGNANGTDNWRGGLTTINERGGEIIDLPKGSRVYPHDVSMKMAKAGAGSPVMIAPVISVDARNASPGVGAEVKAAVQEAMKNMTPVVAKSLREIKLKGIPV